MGRGLLVFLACAIRLALSLDNGAARTPPMGWLSWERFACEVNCDTDPHNCISAQLYKDMADMIVADGWKEAGYEYVNVDDCWVAPTRDAHGLLQADEKKVSRRHRFSCQYIHEKGLKCGLYTDIGATTCGGYLSLNVTADASNTQYERDMDNFASWGIDSLKVDGCNQEPSVMNITYPRLSKALVTSSKSHGRPILYSCSWPAYISIPGHNISDAVYESLAENCNMWRNWIDIYDQWSSVKSIINWWKVHQDSMLRVAGPGHWNDPDMILGGNNGLSDSEYEVQFVIWSIFAAPLLMSNDLRSMSSTMKKLLQNTDVIAVNQDKLGVQGRFISGSAPDGQSVWARPLDKGDVAVALFNGHAGVPGFPVNVTARAREVGLNDTKFVVYDLLKRRFVGDTRPTVFKDEYTVEVACSAVQFLRLEAASSPAIFTEMVV